MCFATVVCGDVVYLRKHEGVFPVTYEGYGLSAYQHRCIDDVDYSSAEVVYNGEMVTTIYVVTTVQNGQTKVKELKLLDKIDDTHIQQMCMLYKDIINLLHMIHGITDEFIIETLLHQSRQRPEKIVYIMYLLLWEFNEMYDKYHYNLTYSVRILNSRKYSLFACPKYALGNMITTVPRSMTYETTILKSAVYAWYSIELPVHKRVLHVDYVTLREWVEFAYRVSIFQCKYMNVNA